MKSLLLRLRSLSLEDLTLTFVAILTVGAFALVAGSTGSELGNGRAAHAYYNQLVAGFQAGQLHLLADVPRGLVELPDPYDPVANKPWRLNPRDEQGVLHDTSYYNGRLYLYFGVTPALLLFWPYHLMATLAPWGLTPDKFY